jgi:hypothetical protein
MRIRIVQNPSIDSVDGIRLDSFQVGEEYAVGNSIGSLMLAEGWAEPVPLDQPAPYVPFSEMDPFAVQPVDAELPRNLVRESHPPYLDEIAAAADFQFRRRPRKDDRFPRSRFKKA